MLGTSGPQATQRTLPGWAVALLLVAIAVALRLPDFGSPIIHADEQYFLLIGQRMIEGAIPYLDIWDRRPVGLFAIYAGAAALPGDDIWGYQLVAALFAGLTAVIVASGARALGASRAGAFAAGVAYLIWLPLLGGRGGQPAVFANLLLASAVRLTLRLPGFAPARLGRLVFSGAVACLLAGVAIQIATGSVFVAVFVLLAHAWWMRRRNARATTILGAAILLLALVIVPTAAVMLGYRALGPVAFDAWWFANVAAPAVRPAYTPSEIAVRLLGIVAQLSPLLLCAAIAWRRRKIRMTQERKLAFGWLAATLIGFIASGIVFEHYALPLVAPLALLAGIALGRIPRVLVGTLLLGLLLMIVERVFIGRDAAGVRAVAQVVRANSRGACPYVFSDDSATYVLSRTCLPTTRAFPGFLSDATEAAATGVDPVAEVQRILADRPLVVVASTQRIETWNRDTVALVKARLARDYRAVFATPRSNYRTVVFLRNDLSLNP